ncbi:MAG: argininosuccinate lyase [Archaeoglobus sp.]|jgi:argininosuccinate lyase|nr:argininosuccinate lyase [Archaeoglobus sp.]
MEKRKISGWGEMGLMYREERLGGMDSKALEFSSSLDHDKNIFKYDILVDVAHVLNLCKSGYLGKEEALKIIEALKEVAKRGLHGKFEDVHEAIEFEVTRITEEGKRMHTGRSRNDEVATCLRMFARDNLLTIAEKLIELLSTILTLAEKDTATIMPGFTHLQFAQPTKLSHHLLAYFDMVERDLERLVDAFRRVNLCPLGSSAFASTSYRLDREYVAKILGFDGVLEHSEDAVSSRDFLIETVFVCSSIMLSLSRIAEEIILFSTLGFIDLPNKYASTSSIMPQKKNPDIAELIRAKTGKTIGNLVSAMAIYKALPFSYNRDFQEMNEILYETMRIVENSVEVMSGMLSEIRFNKSLLEEKAREGFTLATEVADMLVKEFGIPFRDAHKIVGRIISQKMEINSESLETVAKNFGYEIKVEKSKIDEAIDVKKAVERRENIGGTASSEIERMLYERKKKVQSWRRVVRRLKGRILLNLHLIEKEVEKLGGIFHVDW